MSSTVACIESNELMSCKNRIRFQNFETFMLSGVIADSSTPSAIEQRERISAVPVDALKLPDNYRSRPNVERQITDLLVGNTPCKGGCCVTHGLVLQYLLPNHNHSHLYFLQDGRRG